MNLRIFLVSLILLSLVAPLLITNSAFQAGNLTIINPPSNNFVYHDGDKFNITALTPYANAPVLISLLTPANKTYPFPAQTDSSGKLSVVLFTWNSSDPRFPPGTYIVSINVAPPDQTPVAGSFTVQFVPATATINVKVVNQLGLPLQGATVTIVNASNNQVLTTLTTNAQGLASYSFIFITGKTYSFIITATYPGLLSQTQSLTISAPGVYNVTLQLIPQTLQLILKSITVSSVAVPFSAFGNLYSTYLAMGVNATLVVQLLNSGKPQPGAKVSAVLSTPSGSQSLSVKDNGDGTYTISLQVPTLSSMISTLPLNITAKYGSLSTSILVVIGAYQDLTSKINQLTSIVAGLNQTLVQLRSLVQSLNATIVSQQKIITAQQQTISALQSSISALNSSLNSLRTTVNSLQATVSSLNSQISTLQSSLSSSLTLVYVALGLAIVALIIAIVALVQLLRKVK
ncbi:MAG: carboxypeptidase regulatory-like domain-containing protein [Sulfolobaceae archaeon]